MKKVIVTSISNSRIIKKYKSITDAALDVCGQPSHISECASGLRYKHKGYEWRREYDTMGTTKD